MNIYFEVADSLVDQTGGKYFSIYNAGQGSKIVDTYRRLGQLSTRIWQEDETGVKFIKNKLYDTHGYDVDVKEFTWVKLKCQLV